MSDYNDIVYCGYNCKTCIVYKATISNDRDLKEQILRKYSNSINNLTLDDISCLGCYKDSDVLFSFCKECEVRKCGIRINLNNCGECKKYPCEKISRVTKNNVNSQKILDEINCKKDGK